MTKVNTSFTFEENCIIITTAFRDRPTEGETNLKLHFIHTSNICTLEHRNLVFSVHWNNDTFDEIGLNIDLTSEINERK